MQSAHEGAVELREAGGIHAHPGADYRERTTATGSNAYSATDVAPPPEMYRTTSADFKANDEEPPTMMNHSGQIAIDEGYEAIKALPWHAGRSSGSRTGRSSSSSETSSVRSRLDERQHRTPRCKRSRMVTMKRGSVPFAMITNRVAKSALTIEIKCQRTERAMQKWRAETHAKLTDRLPRRLSEYEEKLASDRVAGRRRASEGANPGAQPGTDEGRAEEGLHQHPHRPALRSVQRDRQRAEHGPAADRRIGSGKGRRVRALLRAGVRVGAPDLDHLPLLLGTQERVGGARSRTTIPIRCSPSS